MVLKSIPPEETSGTPVTELPVVHFTAFTRAGTPFATSAGRAVFPVKKQAAVVWRELSGAMEGVKVDLGSKKCTNLLEHSGSERGARQDRWARTTSWILCRRYNEKVGKCVEQKNVEGKDEKKREAGPEKREGKRGKRMQTLPNFLSFLYPYYEGKNHRRVVGTAIAWCAFNVCPCIEYSWPEMQIACTCMIW